MHWHIHQEKYEMMERFALSLSGRERVKDLLEKTYERVLLFNKRDISLKEIFILMRDINKTVCR